MPYSTLADVERIEVNANTFSLGAYMGSSLNLYIDTAGNIGIGDASVSYADVRIYTLYGMAIAAGDTASRPASVPVGTLRYNTDLGVIEVYKASGWRLMAPQVEDPPPSGFAPRAPTVLNDAAVPSGGVTVTGLSNHDWVIVWLSHARINPKRDLDLLLYDSGGTQLTPVENVVSMKRSDGSTVTWTQSSADRVRLLEDTYVDSRTEFTVRLEIHNGVSSTGQAVVVGHAAYDDPATGTFSWAEIFGRVDSATPVDRIQMSSTGSFADGHLLVYGV